MRQVRTCAYEPCDETFELGPKHYRKRFCSTSCSNSARAPKTVVVEKDCDNCGKRLERKPKESVGKFNVRRYCDKDCANLSKVLWKDWELEIELEHLLGTDPPDSIAKRLGYYGVEGLCGRLDKNGQTELRERVTRLHDAAIN